MEGDETGLSSYFHHNHHHHHHHNTTTGTSNTNGLFSNPHHHNNHHHHHQQQQQQQQHNQSSIGGGGGGGAHFSSEPTPLIFPQHSSVTGRAPVASSTPPPPETIRRKRGRPRKYGTSSETPPSATPSTASAKKLSTSTTTTTTSPSPSLPLSSPPRKKEPSSSTVSSPTSSKKAQLLALGNAGQGFTPHVITVAAGEDVAQKIMSFVQQRKRAVCILSASGSISNASLRQPATLGGNVTYEGRFEILSLSGSFLHSEMGGASSRTGGLSVCLSGTDGRIVGGGVGGPLKAAGPVQVIAGSFVFDAKKEANIDFKGETSASKLPPSIGGATVSSSGFRTTTSVRGNDDHQHMGGSNFMLQSRGMHPMPTRQNDWRSALDGTDLGACRSPEDGDDEHLRD